MKSASLIKKHVFHIKRKSIILWDKIGERPDLDGIDLVDWYPVVCCDQNDGEELALQRGQHAWRFWDWKGLDASEQQKEDPGRVSEESGK